MEHMNDVKMHFEEEAREFDGIIKELIPYYRQMVQAVTDSLPFDREEKINVIDLGCGTGTVARAVLDAFPNARITCVDIAQEMLQMARIKLSDAPDTVYINADFSTFSLEGKYDAVVSSLALHHLETDEHKRILYGKIYSSLKKGGVFVNADVVLASTDTLQQRYMERWKGFMLQSIGEDEVEKTWLPKYYREDRPTSLTAHLNMLKYTGFSNVDVVWKYYNYAVYTGMKV